MEKVRKRIDMVNGSLGDKILEFAVPLAFTGILQQVFNAADVAVVGRFVGKNAMAAVGSNAPIVGLMVNLFVGISLGANVVIARFTGQGNEKGVRKSVNTAVLVAVISGVLLTIIGWLVSRPLLELMSVPKQVMPMALAYLRMYLLGMPVILLYNFESAIFRSQGDTTTPLICLLAAGILNVILNLFFVIVVNMTADGVALATVISNVVSSSLMFVILCRSKSNIKIEIKELGINKHILSQMLKIGVPAGLQGMVFSFSNICIQSAVNSLGADIMAASSAAFNIEIFAYYIINAFGQASTTFIGQNSGAGKPDRCKRTLRLGLMQAFAVTVVISSLGILMAEPLLRVFNDDATVLHYGKIRLMFILIPEVLNVIIELFSGTMRGFGYSLGPALISLLGICGTRLIWVFLVFDHHSTFAMLMTCYPISWAVTAVALIILYLIKKKKFYLSVKSTGNE